MGTKSRSALHFFRPILSGATLSGRLIACVGAAIGISLTVLVCAAFPPITADLPIIVAPLGASAVLVFAVPSSPLAQPWPVLGGNVISTVIGVAAFQHVPNATLAAGVAVGGAILAMSLLRCLHPPGGAAALTAVIGSEGVHAAGYSFAFAPVAINSIALISIAFLYHRATAHTYPHRAVPGPATEDRSRLEHADIDAALQDMHESFDISREDLDALFAHANRHASARLAGMAKGVEPRERR